MTSSSSGPSLFSISGFGKDLAHPTWREPGTDLIRLAAPPTPTASS
jgi:hypothetical protein